MFFCVVFFWGGLIYPVLKRKSISASFTFINNFIEPDLMQKEAGLISQNLVLMYLTYKACLESLYYLFM